MKNIEAISELCRSSKDRGDWLDQQACIRAAVAVEWWDAIGFAVPETIAQRLTGGGNLGEVARELNRVLADNFGQTPLEIEMRILTGEDDRWIDERINAMPRQEPVQMRHEDEIDRGPRPY